MSEMWKVSFVVPVYNVDKYLDECISSMLTQQNIESEIILVDDGSSDKSRELCAAYAENNTNIIFHMQEHQGASVARNWGIDHATGEWVCFVDSDDYLKENSLENILGATSSEHQIIYADYASIKESGRMIEHSYRDANEQFNANDLVVFHRATLNKRFGRKNLSITTPWPKLYRREFLDTYGIRFTPGIKKSQDTLFNFMATHYATSGLYVSQVMYIHRYNPGSLCHGIMEDAPEDMHRQMTIIKDCMAEWGELEKLRQDYYTRGTVYLLKALMLDSLNPLNSGSYRMRRKRFISAVSMSEFHKSLYGVKLQGFKWTEKLAIHLVRMHMFAFLTIMNKRYKKIKAK